MTERAVIYARVSTEDQLENTSISSQIEDCKKYIESKGYQLVGDPFVDSQSGESVPRPGLDDAFDFWDEFGFDIFVVKNDDRLARSIDTLHEIKTQLEIYRDAKIEYAEGPNEQSEDMNWMRDLLTHVANKENIDRAKRTKRGKLEKARRGVYPSGRAPYGYLINKNAPGGLEVILGEADTVREIFRSYNSGRSIRAITDDLNAKNIQPDRGEKWGKSSVARILSSEIYTGKAFYNQRRTGKIKLTNKRWVKLRPESEWIPFEVTPIIDPGEFKKAQGQRSDNRETIRRQPKRFYLLSGMVRCAECGKPYNCQASPAGKHRRTNEALFYRHRIKNGGCKNRTVSARVLDPIAWQTVLSQLLEPRGLTTGIDGINSRDKTDLERKIEKRAGLEKKIENLQVKLFRYDDMYADPAIALTKDDYLKHRKEIQDSIADLRVRVRELDRLIGNVPTPEERAEFEQLAQEIRNRIQNSDWQDTPENRRAIMKALRFQVLIPRAGDFEFSLIDFV
jgi:site-specific DNA recombinase